MPNLSPTGRNSNPDYRSQYNALKYPERDKKIKSPNPSSNLSANIEKIEAKYWHNRLVSFCIKTINRIIHPPKSYQIHELLSEFSSYPSAKVLAALKLHCEKGGTNISLKSDTSLIIDGTISLYPEAHRKVIETLKLSPVEIGFEYYRNGKMVPKGYLEHLLLPELAQRVLSAKDELITTTAKLTAVQATINNINKANELVGIEAKKVNLLEDEHFSFERLLKLKQGIRNNIIQSIEEQKCLK
ncbi:MAG: hypothetical protein ACPGEF_02915, partial [Endozoicomonas sp.]